MINPYLLHEKFVQMGAQRHKLKNEMLLILPQIYESGIYKKYCATIVEYASKYGDIARSTVIKRLRLEENLHEKPFLKEAIKDVGIHKVALVAKLATKETDQAFADKVKNMSKSAVQTLSKELRQSAKVSGQAFHESAKQACLEMAVDRVKDQHCHAVPQTMKIELDSEMTFLFLKLKKKFGKNLNNKEMMRIILQKMNDVENARLKSKKHDERKIEKTSPVTLLPTGVMPARRITRYISAEQDREISRETLTKKYNQCSYPGCNKPAEVRHHKNRFYESKNHSSVIPLCRDHHEFAHNGLIINEIDEEKNWQLDVTNMPVQKADRLYRKYHKQAVLL